MKNIFEHLGYERERETVGQYSILIQLLQSISTIYFSVSSLDKALKTCMSQPIDCSLFSCTSLSFECIMSATDYEKGNQFFHCKRTYCYDCGDNLVKVIIWKMC